MKRVNFYLPAKDLRSLQSFVSEGGLKQSVFVRDAVKEKIDRDRIGANVETARDAMEEILESLRYEMARMRTDVIEDAQRTAALLREENQLSNARNEQLLQAFVRKLAGLEEPTAQPPAKASRGPLPNPSAPAQRSSIPGIND